MKNVELKDVETHVAIAGNVEIGGICPIIAITPRETSHGCCRGTDSSQGRKLKVPLLFCGAEKEENTLFHCGACRSTSYCGKKCQVSAWRQHKPICDSMQTLSKDFEETVFVPSLTNAENGDVYATHVTPKEKSRVAKLIGSKCIVLCKLNGVEPLFYWTMEPMYHSPACKSCPNVLQRQN